MRTTSIILTRNCGHSVDRTLRTAARLTDDVVVIDTGSTDDTCERVLDTPGVRLERIAWPDSFAAARNSAFELVNDGLLVHLDSDEWATDDQAEHGRALLRTLRDPAGCWSPVVADIGGQHKAYHLPRIVAADSPLRFRYRVHERLYAGGAEAFPETIELELLHDGYTDSNLSRFRKIDRNLSLLETTIGEYPGDPHPLFFWLRDGLETRDPDANRAALAAVDAAAGDGDTRGMNFRILARKVLLEHEWHTRGPHPQTVELAASLLELAEGDPDAVYVTEMSVVMRAHQQVHESMGRVARARQACPDDLEWSMSATPAHLDALLAEQLRTLGDPREQGFRDGLRHRWSDPYLDRPSGHTQ